MPATGLFFIPTTSAEASPLPSFLSRITSLYNATPLPPWRLDHRLFRETSKATAPTNLSSSVDEQFKASGPRYLQVLSLSHHTTHSHVAITTTLPPSQTRAGTPASSTVSGESSGEPATIIAIPSGNLSEDFLHLVISKFGPLWTSRQIANVRNGQAFEVGDYTIRVGELVQGNNTAAMLGRGVVVEIEWTGGVGEQESEQGGGTILAFWETLDVKNARECIHVAGLEEGFGSVRQWFEILRLRN